jgi:hypothetical protein
MIDLFLFLTSSKFHSSVTRMIDAYKHVRVIGITTSQKIQMPINMWSQWDHNFAENSTLDCVCSAIHEW